MPAMTLPVFRLGYLMAMAAFALEEFVLIRAVSTIARSDAAGRRLERLIIAISAAGLGLTGATSGVWGAVLAGGIGNLVGVALALFGVVLRYWSRRTLGRFFTIGVVTQEGHVVVRDGPYAFVRHPGYLGFLLFCIGLPLIVGNWPVLAALGGAMLILFSALIRVEDRLLVAELGEPYREYARRTARLVPGVW